MIPRRRLVFVKNVARAICFGADPSFAWMIGTARPAEMLEVKVSEDCVVKQYFMRIELCNLATLLYQGNLIN